MCTIDGSKVANKTEDENYLHTLEADPNDEDPVGAKIHQNLANFALKSDKLKALLGKHAKPENCTDITVAKVNPGIWSQMNNFKRKADLRLGNVQQALQKATFGLLKSCDTLEPKQDSVSREILSQKIDAIAVIEHAVGELSRLRKEQINPALKLEFYSLCNAANESTLQTVRPAFWHRFGKANSRRQRR